MVSRPRIIIAAMVVVAALLGVMVWRSIPDLPTIEPPRTAETTGEFFDAEVYEYLDDSEREILKRFNEAPLTSDSFSEGIIYRLILLPTFDEPILVQVRVDAAGPYIKTKILNGVGGYGIEKFGVLAFNEERQLTRAEWDKLTETVRHSGFWGDPGIDRTDEPVNDGASWSLYGRDFGAFHRIHRITPKPKSLTLFRYILRLAGHEDDYRGYWQDDSNV